MSNTSKNQDEYFMGLALDLAKKGEDKVWPNPKVGCVIVKDGELIASGYHKEFGADHAEADAFNNTQNDVAGATLYCNLEPCCHLDKKTPPCAQRIVKEKITKVVIANLDKNPKVAGAGVELLRKNGIEVVTGVLEKEGRVLNDKFFEHIQNK